MEWDQLYEEGLEDCSHPERIVDAACWVAEALLERESIEIALAPGNGTRYCWLFVPFDSTRKADLNGGLESASTSTFGVWIVDLNINKTVYSLSFGVRDGPPHWTYISEKWFDGKFNFDLVVFYELLRLIMLQMERT